MSTHAPKALLSANNKPEQSTQQQWLAAALEGAFSFKVGSTRIKPLSRSFYLQQGAAN